MESHSHTPEIPKGENFPPLSLGGQLETDHSKKGKGQPKRAKVKGGGDCGVISFVCPGG